MILAIRTDKPEAEIALIHKDVVIDRILWEAHRQLAETLHSKIGELLSKNNADYKALAGLVYYEGPGSFTGLRIGASVVNAIAASFRIPAVQVATDSWELDGASMLADVTYKESSIVLPQYGSLAHTTTPKK